MLLLALTLAVARLASSSPEAHAFEFGGFPHHFFDTDLPKAKTFELGQVRPSQLILPSGTQQANSFQLGPASQPQLSYPSVTQQTNNFELGHIPQTQYSPQLSLLPAGNYELSQGPQSQLIQAQYDDSPLQSNLQSSRVLSTPYQQQYSAFANSQYPQTSNYPVSQTQLKLINHLGRRLTVGFAWRYLDWIVPTVQLTGKNFTLGNPLSQDVDIDSRGRIFVTSPQWLEGTPITLSVITAEDGPGGPLLTPYPDWTWHQSDCEKLVSVYRIAIDECDRMWMVDTGTAEGKPVCPAKIVVFDLRTDQQYLKYVIPADQTVGHTASYVTPVVEVGDTCEDTYLYVPDVLKHGLLVYSLKENRSWRLDNTPGNAFGHDEEATNLTIAGETFDLTDGTLGMSLTARGFFAKRYLYFNSLASFYQKFTDTDSLKISDKFELPVYQSIQKRISQAGAQATSRTGATFFQLAEYTALACWNVERPFTPENVIVLVQDEETLQYISSMKILTNVHGEEELWFNTNRLQRTINKTRKINEINFRFMRGKVEDLIRGTKCESTGRRGDAPSLLGWKRI